MHVCEPNSNRLSLHSLFIFGISKFSRFCIKTNKIMLHLLVERFLVYPLYNVISILAITILAWMIWILFYRPYDFVKDYTDYGYDHVHFLKGSNRKKNLVNLLLKRRKVGHLPPPYPNSWYSVLESDKLAVKQVKEVYVLGQNLVVWRGEKSGQAFVSDAYCPHLGAHLGVGGTVKGNCIQCPFHQWSFDGCENGAVVDVPYTKQQTSNAKLPGLNLWRVVEANGFIWIWYHCKNMDPTWFPEEINEINGDTTWKYRGRSEFQVTCHIQEIPENGADISHLEALHENPALFPVNFLKFSELLGKIIKHKWTASWTVNDDPKGKHESLVNFIHYFSLFGDTIKFGRINVKGRQIGAGMVVLHLETPIGKGVFIQSVAPIEPLLQRITHRFYSERTFIHPIALLALRGEAIQISRDVEIWNRKCFLSRPNLVKEDNQIKSFRRWFSQFYSDGHENEKTYFTYFNGSKVDF